MSWEITYVDKQGRTQVHVNNNSVSDARGWTESLARQHGKATCEHIADGPYDYSRKRTHVVTEGDR